jgi:HlyD family secretion protein
MDRALDPEVIRSGRRRRFGIGLGAVAVVVGGFALLPGLLRPSVRREALRTARVERGAVEAVLQASGNAVPALERALSSPVDARVERILRRAGEAVSAGDEIVVLDTAAARLDLGRLDDRVAQKESEERQARLALDLELESLAGRAESQRLEASVARYRAEQHKKLRAEGLTSDEALRTSEVEAQKAAIEVEQAERAIAAARSAGAARVDGLALDLGILRKERDEARRLLEQSTARAERDGVVTWVVPQEGATVRRGEVVARVADLGSFRVEATISDVHSARLAVGLPARILLGDAHRGGQTLAGRVASVNPTIENGVLRFTVELDDPKTAALRNNQRVSVAVTSGHAERTLRVARGSFVEDGGESLFVVDGGRAVRRPARLGYDVVEIVETPGGPREGDEVILSDLKEYAGLDELRLR